MPRPRANSDLIVCHLCFDSRDFLIGLFFDSDCILQPSRPDQLPLPFHAPDVFKEQVFGCLFLKQLEGVPTVSAPLFRS